MSKTKKKALIFLAVALAVCLLGSIFASLVQSGFGKVSVENYNNKTLTEIAGTIEANNAASGKNIAVSFSPSTTAKMTYKVLIPKNATPETPAPAVVIMHGGLSNKDTTAPVFIELARRGYVVIAFDAMGHGKTDKAVDALTHNTMGMEAMVELAMSMSCVDETQIGVTGHSWGNNGSAAVINAINLGTENPRINALLIAQGSLAVFDLQPGSMDGVIFGFSAGKYDEMDVTYFGSYNFTTTPFALSWIKEVYPAFDGTEVPVGRHQIWRCRRPRALQPGQHTPCRSVFRDRRWYQHQLLLRRFRNACRCQLYPLLQPDLGLVHRLQCDRTCRVVCSSAGGLQSAASHTHVQTSQRFGR